LGQLGNDNTTDTNTPGAPINLGTGRTATAVTTKGLHTCALLDNGQVTCFGLNQNGQLGNGNTNNNNAPNTTVTLPAGRTATAISTSSDYHTCALLDNDQVTCWGQNSFGELGLGDTNGASTPRDIINLGSDRRVISISSGQFHNCALLDDSTVKCWGSNGLGQLGLGDTNHRGDSTNEMGDNLSTVNLLAPSVTASSIIDQSTEIRFSITFSDNVFGLESDDFTQSGTATDCTFSPWSSQAIAGLPVVVIANCATSGSVDITLNKDSVFDINGNTGPYSSYEFASTEIDVTSPTATFVTTQNSSEDLFTSFALRLKFDEYITDLTPDDFEYTGSAQGCQFSVPFSAARPEVEIFIMVRCKTGGTIQVTLKANAVKDVSGNTGPVNDLQFALLTLDPYVTRIPIQIDGGDDHTCALFNDGRVKCWGTNTSGQLGVGPGNEFARGLTPGSMGDNAAFIDFGRSRHSFVVSITSGKDFNCALLSNGRPMCWGNDSLSQLGRSTGDNFVPESIQQGLEVTQISAGENHACALNARGAITCWGANDKGQLAIGSISTPKNYDDRNVINFYGQELIATQVTAGSNHTCAILLGGDVSCWGDNANGQLGFDPTTTPTLSSPSTFLDLQNNRSALSISAGGNHTCAILNDDTLSCWGANSSGQIGNGNSGTDAITPTDVAFDNSLHATFVAAGGEFTCAILSDSSTRCWGANGSGQLGHGDSVNTDTPGSALDFAGTRKANVLGTGTAHSCAVLDDLTTKCWGNNSSGELGLESSAGRGTDPNDLNGIVTDVRLFDRVVATDHSDLSSGIVNPVILTFAFDKAIHNLEWSDLSFIPDPNPQSPTYATGCSAGILVTSAEEDEDIDLYVMCNTSGEVHLQLDAYSVTDLNGYKGPESRFLFPVFTIDASRVVVTPSAYPAVIGASGSFNFTADKWFEGLGENDFMNVAQTNAAGGCIFTSATEVTGAIAGDTVEVFVSCETEGNLIPRMMPGSIFDKAGNPGPLMGQIFPSMIVDLTAPAASIMMPNPAPSAYPFSFTTSFSENVSGITGADFVNAGTAIGCVFTPSASSASQGSALSVSVTCVSSGTITPRLAANTVADIAGNVGPASQATGSSSSIIIATPPTTTPPSTPPTTTPPSTPPTTTPPSTPPTTTPPSNRVSALSALTPARILNTRSGVGVRAGRVVNQSVELQVTGAGGVPSSGVSSVSMNVTVTETTAGDAGGYVTVYPCGALPDASNLNFVAGQTVPNAVITPVSASGKVCFYVYGGAHLIADVNGWSAPGSGFTPVTPARVLNTRGGSRVVNSTTELQVTGVGSIPANGVGAVSLNVTVTTTTASDAGGYVTVYPCGTLPDASNLNFVAGQTIPNAVITPVSASGKVCFYVFGGAHLIADINGWYATGNGFVGVTPSRVLNTRGGNRVVGTTKELQVTGVGSIPSSDVGAVSLNVTVTDTTADDFGGYVTVYPCGTRPEASNLNFVAGQTIPNAVITPVSANGKVCFYVFGGAHLIADINGYYTS
jgi:alpha-tubulin suppressor-like RCC1 family protein/uncharacterized ParB-like nuclease family protein